MGVGGGGVGCEGGDGGVSVGVWVVVSVGGCGGVSGGWGCESGWVGGVSVGVIVRVCVHVYVCDNVYKFYPSLSLLGKLQRGEGGRD